MLNTAMNDPARASQPATGGVPITGSAQTLDETGRGLLITVSGDITWVTQNNSVITWVGIPVGIWEITVRSITTSTVTGYVLI